MQFWYWAIWKKIFRAPARNQTRMFSSPRVILQSYNAMQINTIVKKTVKIENRI
jgi:hypothetical protein